MLLKKIRRRRRDGRQTSETSQSDPDVDKDRVVYKIAKAVAQSIKNGGTLGDDRDVSDDDKKPKSGAGSTFGGKGKNRYGGKRE